MGQEMCFLSKEIDQLIYRKENTRALDLPAPQPWLHSQVPFSSSFALKPSPAYA